MVKCSFCRENIEPGTGILFAKNDGRIFNFCSAKCEKHLLTLDHKPRETKWSEAYVKGTTKEKTAETTLAAPKVAEKKTQ